MRCYGVLFRQGSFSTGQMEVSALKYSGGIGLHARSPLLRLQSDERLIGLVRRGNSVAFEVLVSRYESRLLAFCRSTMLACDPSPRFLLHGTKGSFLKNAPNAPHDGDTRYGYLDLTFTF